MVGKGYSSERCSAVGSVTDGTAVVSGRLVPAGRVGVMAVPVAAGIDRSDRLQLTLKPIMSKEQENRIVFNNVLMLKDLQG